MSPSKMAHRKRTITVVHDGLLDGDRLEVAAGTERAGSTDSPLTLATAGTAVAVRVFGMNGGGLALAEAYIVDISADAGDVTIDVTSGEPAVGTAGEPVGDAPAPAPLTDGEMPS